jgi:hypothetical protein
MATPETPQPGPAPPAPPRRGWGVGRVLLLVVGILAVLFGTLLLAGGGLALWLDQSRRDSDGYLTTPTERLQTATFALASTGLDIAHPRGPDFATNPDRFGHVKVEATSLAGRRLFVGIGPEDAVDRYLRRVAHDEVTSLDFHPFRATYERSGGGAPRTRPDAQRFWAARVQGSPNETLRWDVASGDWSVVVMNADASRGVDVDVAVGARLAFLIWVAVGLLIAGAVVVAVAVLLIYLALRTPRAPPAPAAA